MEKVLLSYRKPRVEVKGKKDLAVTNKTNSCVYRREKSPTIWKASKKDSEARRNLWSSLNI